MSFPATKLTVGIKALNEERHIAQAVESALKACDMVGGGEVILADSGSSDRTVEIASRYAIRIVQLANPEDRSCGAGAQLAFQHAQGEFFYLLDGDMALDPAFVKAGIAYLEQHPDVAGVGGYVQEMVTEAHEFEIRAEAVMADRNWLPGLVDRLDCGGLYRRDAILEVGYFADRNLHAFEELELGARLRCRGWKLARIGDLAVQHYGHAVSGYKLLWRRVRSGYAGATGEVFRSSLGNRQFSFLLRTFGHLRNASIVLAWWLILATLVISGRLLALLVALLLPIVFLIVRRRSLRLGFFSFVSWNANAWGLISGFVRRRTDPMRPLASKIIDP
jgi:glycosyltransferase involved in cell wall biosynthesis